MASLDRKMPLLVLALHVWKSSWSQLQLQLSIKLDASHLLSGILIGPDLLLNSSGVGCCFHTHAAIEGAELELGLGSL